MASLRQLGIKALMAGGLAGALIAPSVSLADGEKAEKKESRDSRPLFDPDALERGAKALREINKSPYAKQVRHGMPLVRAAHAMEVASLSIVNICASERTLSV